MKKLLLALLLLPCTANAEKLDLKYEASWTGIKAGVAEVEIDEDKDKYNIHVTAASSGIVKKFTNYSTDNTVDGIISNGKYQPVHYNTNWQPKKSPMQNVMVTYGKDGKVSEVANPPEKRGKRPEVADKEKQGLPDPISAAMNARLKVREIIESGQQLPQKFTIRIFDSRRVTDLNFNVIGYELVKFNGIKQKLLKVSFGRTPVTGYNKKELSKHEEQNPPVNIYADENYLPVMASGQAVIGEVSIKLVK